MCSGIEVAWTPETVGGVGPETWIRAAACELLCAEYSAVAACWTHCLLQKVMLGSNQWVQQ